LTTLYTAASAAGSGYALQKCGTYLPEMSSETYIALTAAYVASGAVPVGWALYNRTPQGRKRLAQRKLNKLCGEPLIGEIKLGGDELECISRIYVNKDFPYIEGLHNLQKNNTQINEIMSLLEKGRKDIKDSEDELLESYEDITQETKQLRERVLRAIKRVRDLPDYTKRLKYFNEMHAQEKQAIAQQAQANAQNKIAVGAILTGVGSIVSAGAKVIQAFNPFKK
jgi:DNA-binding transcriptional MerR regulator